MSQAVFYTPSFLLRENKRENKQVKLQTLIRTLEQEDFKVIGNTLELENLSVLPETLVCSLLAQIDLLEGDSFNFVNLKQLFLEEIFDLVKKFVQKRVKQKAGNIIFLVNADALGTLDSSDSSGSLKAEKELFFSLQGGLIGLVKTIQREYGKRKIRANCLRIDFEELEQAELLSAIAFSQKNFGTAGHLFDLDLAKSL